LSFAGALSLAGKLAMGGLVLSYLRLRHGLLSAMSAHFSWNAFAVGIALPGG
jgi:membrane protease YdiL (CAAX protease family)